MNMGPLSAFMRLLGGFFMKRSFRDDPIYKAIFTEYVTQLCTDKTNIMFYIEGTRSRSNKMLDPKFGVLKFITDSFFDKKVGEITFVPININYTRLFEDTTLTGELTGNPKTGESLGRVLSSSIETLSFNYGSLYLDFHDPINISEDLNELTEARP